MSKKILYICQEITPYLPEDVISKNCRHLPQLIQEKGHEIRTFTPRYGSINERRNQLHEVIRLSGMNLIINDTDHPLIIKVASIQAARMQVYFIDNDDFFKRKGTVVDSKGVDYKDNDERAVFFARGVLETIKKLRWMPDVIECHGWFSSLVGLYIKTNYAVDSLFKKSKVVYSLYNNDFKGVFPTSFYSVLLQDKIKPSLIESIKGKELNFVDFQKFILEFVDGVIEAEADTNSEVKDYIQQSGKSFLPFPGSLESGIDAINEFYENL